MTRPWHRFKPYVIIPMVIGGLALAVLVAFLLGLIVMLLWNWLMPVIFGLPEISYWQGWGLVLLAHILFKAGPHHRDHEEGSGREREWKRKFRDRINRGFDHGPSEGPSDQERGERPAGSDEEPPPGPQEPRAPRGGQ